VKFVFCS